MHMFTPRLNSPTQGRQRPLTRTSLGMWRVMRLKLRLVSGVAVAGVAVGTLGALTGCGWLPGTTFEDDTSLTDEINSVRLDSGDGAVTLNGEKDAKKVSIHREIEYRDDKPGATHKVEDGVLVLGGCGRHCSVNYTVDLPAGLPIEGKTSNGSIALSAMDTVKVKTTNGAIELKNITGDIDVTTNNGRVRGSGLTGDRVSVETSNGDVNLNAAEPRDVRAKTSNGSIDVAVPPARYDVSTDTSNGGEDIGVDTETGADRTLDLSTSNGDITVKPR